MRYKILPVAIFGSGYFDNESNYLIKQKINSFLYSLLYNIKQI